MGLLCSWAAAVAASQSSIQSMPAAFQSSSDLTKTLSNREKDKRRKKETLGDEIRPRMLMTGEWVRVEERTGAITHPRTLSSLSIGANHYQYLL